MTTYHYIIVAVLIFWILAYFRVSLLVWTNVFAVLLAVHTFASTSVILSVIAWALFILIVVPISIPAIRRRIISDKVLPIMKKAIPSLSQTEKDALEAGTVWWDGDLFSGKPNWKKLLATQSPALTNEEQTFIDGPVQTLCDKIDDWQTNHEAFDLSPEVWQYIKDNKFFGIIIPKKYGGLAFSALAHSEIVSKLASRSITAAVTVMVPNSLGPAELLLHYGTDEQKSHYLPRLAGGKEIPCFALTGPEAGSDASSIPDTGFVCYRKNSEGEKDVLGIRLNWDKRYITLGPVATVLGLAFKLYDPDHLLGKTENIGITLALIPTNTPGIDIGRRHMPLNLAFQNGPNSGKDVFIPLDWVIGGQQRVGEGWRMLMESLAAGRSISLPALSTGGGKLACRATGAYARIRKQFRTPIGQFEGIEEALARMAGYTYQMDAARKMTAVAVDQGERPSVISAIVKYNLTSRMRSIITDAMDVQGGSGICMGPRNILGRIYQAIPVGITVEGANILTRTLITFGQGAIRCHPYILKEIQAVAETDSEAASKGFDKALFGHIGFTISNVFRTVFLGLTGAFFVQAPGTKEKHFYKQATRLSSSFALISDIGLLILGGALKRKEKLSGRLADVLSQLYLISATLKHFSDQGQKPADFPLVQWSCEDALYQSQQSLLEFLRNFPNKPVAWLLRIVCFPLGRPYAPPSDKLGHRIANILLEPSATRDRLTQGIYMPITTTETLGRLEDALVKIIKAEPIEKKIISAQRKGEIIGYDLTELSKDAVNKDIIDQSEADLLIAADNARKDVIKVDDFAADYLSKGLSKEEPTEPSAKPSTKLSTKEGQEDPDSAAEDFGGEDSVVENSVIEKNAVTKRTSGEHV
ncbi:MAG: acyl-CoA dehydrogenase [Gammaproteobacteria bacterium]|nr:acyl-CoA dehydrogenase [Gammaproteobacteria bacterium]